MAQYGIKFKVGSKRNVISIWKAFQDYSTVQVVCLIGDKIENGTNVIFRIYTKEGEHLDWGEITNESPNCQTILADYYHSLSSKKKWLLEAIPIINNQISDFTSFDLVFIVSDGDDGDLVIPKDEEVYQHQ